MDIHVENRQHIAIAKIPLKDLDAANVTEFKADMAPILQNTQKLVVDMSELQFVDSSGLGALLSCLRQLTANGGDLKLCSMTKQVRATFELVRMHRIFEIFENCDQAVEAFSGRAGSPRA